MTAATAPAPERAPLVPTRARLAGLAAAATGVVCLAVVPVDGPGVVRALVAALLVWLAALDLEFRLLPNRLVLPATVLVLAAGALVDPSSAAERLLAGLGAGAFFLLAAILRPADLGMGDVKLVTLVGVTLGAATLTALAAAFLVLALLTIGLVAAAGRAALKRQLPLAPFFAAGVAVTVLTAF